MEIRRKRQEKQEEEQEKQEKKNEEEKEEDRGKEGKEGEEGKVQWFTFIFTILFISSKNLLNPHILLNSFSIRLAITGVTRPLRPLEHRAKLHTLSKVISNPKHYKISFSHIFSSPSPLLTLIPFTYSDSRMSSGSCLLYCVGPSGSICQPMTAPSGLLDIISNLCARTCVYDCSNFM